MRITAKGRVITLEDDIQRAWKRHGWKVEEEQVPAGVDKKGRRTWIIKAKPIDALTQKLTKKGSRRKRRFPAVQIGRKGEIRL